MGQPSIKKRGLQYPALFPWPWTLSIHHMTRSDGQSIAGPSVYSFQTSLVFFLSTPNGWNVNMYMNVKWIIWSHSIFFFEIKKKLIGKPTEPLIMWLPTVFLQVLNFKWESFIYSEEVRVLCSSLQVNLIRLILFIIPLCHWC